jgi:hypothetical protein
MEIGVQLTPFLEASPRGFVGMLRVPPEALAGAAARDLRALPDGDFLSIAGAVVGENREPYERLRPCGAQACPRC